MAGSKKKGKGGTSTKKDHSSSSEAGDSGPATATMGSVSTTAGSSGLLDIAVSVARASGTDPSFAERESYWRLWHEHASHPVDYKTDRLKDYGEDLNHSAVKLQRPCNEASFFLFAVAMVEKLEKAKRASEGVTD